MSVDVQQSRIAALLNEQERRERLMIAWADGLKVQVEKRLASHEISGSLFVSKVDLRREMDFIKHQLEEFTLTLKEMP